MRNSEVTHANEFISTLELQKRTDMARSGVGMARERGRAGHLNTAGNRRSSLAVNKLSTGLMHVHGLRCWGMWVGWRGNLFPPTFYRNPTPVRAHSRKLPRSNHRAQFTSTAYLFTSVVALRDFWCQEVMENRWPVEETKATHIKTM